MDMDNVLKIPRYLKKTHGHGYCFRKSEIFKKMCVLEKLVSAFIKKFADTDIGLKYQLIV
jgi:hypothetical protein